MKLARATSDGSREDYRPTRIFSNHSVKSAWFSYSMNATAPSSARLIRSSRILPQRPAFRFHRYADLRGHASYKRIEGDVQTLKTTQDLFQKSLHEYTITHAIEDRNVLSFHVDYYKADGKDSSKPGETPAKRAVVDTILAKHDAATGGRKFNAILATASINDAIEYYGIFEKAQAEKQKAHPSSSRSTSPRFSLHRLTSAPT